MGEAQGHFLRATSKDQKLVEGTAPDLYTSALLAEINRFDQAAVIRQAKEYKAQ